jgi:hypothetical protein
MPMGLILALKVQEGGGGGASAVPLTSRTRQGSARGLVSISIDKVSIKYRY